MSARSATKKGKALAASKDDAPKTNWRRVMGDGYLVVAGIAQFPSLILFTGSINARIHLGRTVGFKQQHIVRRKTIAHLHPRASHRHTRNGKANGIGGFFSQKALNNFRRNMTFKDIAGGRNGGMARLIFGCNAVFGFDVIKRGGVMDVGAESLRLHMINPFLAATASRTLVNIQKLRRLFGGYATGSG